MGKRVPALAILSRFSSVFFLLLSGSRNTRAGHQEILPDAEELPDRGVVEIRCSHGEIRAPLQPGTE